MIPVEFPQANRTLRPPDGYEESQVMLMSAYIGEVERGSCEGAPIVVVAWMPTEEELMQLNTGTPIFLSFIGGIPPHFPTTSFEQAITPA